MADVHTAAVSGYSVGAEVYAKARPDYPGEMVDWLRDTMRLGPGKAALDLGAGTGKFLAPLKATGAEVAAVEPVDAMRTRLAKDHPEVQALAGSAAAIPLPSACMDAVICAQSFHWFATRETMAEIKRVLKPGGALGLVWNVRDESVDWVAALTRIIDTYEQGEPRYRSGDWRKMFPADGFGPLELTTMAHAGARGSADDVIVGRTMSTSFIAALPEDEKSRIRARVRTLIDATPALSGQATVTFPYFTEAYSCRNTG